MNTAQKISENNQKLITVFGGSGFVGRYVVKALASRGYRIRVACRRPDLAGHLRPIGTVGQVQPIQANLRYPDSVAKALAGADGVVNLVGILYASGKQNFSTVQARGANIVGQAAKAEGIKNIIHLSAIGADKQSNIAYQRTKAEGEEAVLAAVPEAIILRPSIIFGAEDNFFNLFAGIATKTPVLPLIGGGKTLFQPIYVGDVAEVVARTIDGELAAGKTYELGGPDVASFKTCLELMLEITQRKPMLLSVPFALAKLKAAFLQLLPKPLLTVDQVRMLEKDNIVSEKAKQEGRTLDGLGIQGQAMNVILPTYLERFRPYGQFAPKSS